MRKTKEHRRPSYTITATLAAHIRTFRQMNNLSQEDFADMCELHRTYIGSVERGERNVTLSTLEVFATVIGVSVSELLDRETPKMRKM